MAEWEQWEHSGLTTTPVQSVFLCFIEWSDLLKILTYKCFDFQVFLGDISSKHTQKQVMSQSLEPSFK